MDQPIQTLPQGLVLTFDVWCWPWPWAWQFRFRYYQEDEMEDAGSDWSYKVCTWHNNNKVFNKLKRELERLIKSSWHVNSWQKFSVKSWQSLKFSVKTWQSLKFSVKAWQIFSVKAWQSFLAYLCEVLTDFFLSSVDRYFSLNSNPSWQIFEPLDRYWILLTEIFCQGGSN